MTRILALVLLAFSVNFAGAGELGVKTPVHIAMPQSMVVDVEASQIDLLGNKFSTLMSEFTGLKGQLDIGGDPFEVAKKLQDGKAHLAAFQGIEFAWVRSKHKDLEPLMVALSSNKTVEAVLVVKKGGPEGLAALKGKTLAIPKRSKEHTGIFLTGALEKAGGKDVKEFFKEVTAPAGPEKALDVVLGGMADAAVVDQSSLDFYQRIKPGQFAQLQVVEKSQSFPPAVIVYRKGALEPALLERFKKGMLKANSSDRGQDLMANWNITSFEAVPEDFLQQVEKVEKVGKR